MGQPWPEVGGAQESRCGCKWTIKGFKKNKKKKNKGDKVWLESKNLKTTHPTTKLRALRYGPFEVTEIIRSTTYRLKLPPQWKIHNALHASLLTPYKTTEEHGENFPQQLPEVINGEEEWVVERVLDSRWIGQKRRLQYL